MSTIDNHIVKSIANTLAIDNLKNANSVNRFSDFKFYENHRAAWLNIMALSYVFCAYGLSLCLITIQVWYLNLLGVFLLVHSLTWSAFFAHEFFHYNIFSSISRNVLVGKAMLFLTGSCYQSFQQLASHHLAHHIHRADFSPFHPFSLSDFLKGLPKLVQRLIVFAEWLCIPALNLIFRWIIALAPFFDANRRDERWRNASLLLIRGSLFASLAIYSPRGIFLYFIAYVVFLNVIQFSECFQHTYSAFHIDERKAPKHSQEYDENNTYSLVLPQHLSWLSSLIFLNNNYHNAHHRLMNCPWYLLPNLDRELYSRNYQQYLSVSKLIKNYFRHRIHRLFEGQGTVEKVEKGLDIDSFAGASGMSFMLLRKPFNWLNLGS